jgi:trans-aconitate 2-methyltransferase
VNFLGIDASVEMLAKSKPLVHHKLKFAHTTIEEFAASETQWDLIFSNAALQWTDDHAALFPKLIAKLNPGGQFAVQMPVQKENALNQLLSELVNEDPFVRWLNGFHRSSPVLDMDAYAQLLYDNGVQDFNVSLRIYPIIGQSEIHLCQFIAGSALIPYMERLDAAQQEHFRTEYVKRIRARFVTFPALYPFKRILMHGFRA